MTPWFRPFAILVKEKHVFMTALKCPTQSKRPLDKNQSSKFCQSGVKQTHFQNLKEKRKWFFFFLSQGHFKNVKIARQCIQTKKWNNWNKFQLTLQIVYYNQGVVEINWGAPKQTSRCSKENLNPKNKTVPDKTHVALGECRNTTRHKRQKRSHGIALSLFSPFALSRVF